MSVQHGAMRFLAGMLAATLLHAAALAPTTHLRYMMFYGTDVAAQHDWLTHLSGDAVSLPEMVRARARYPWLRGFAKPYGIFNRTPGSEGLASGWSRALDGFIARVGPLVRNGTVVGVFLGDELCCSGVPLANVTTVTDALKAAWPDVATYLNECNTCLYGDASSCDLVSRWAAVPASIDLVSVDLYDLRDDDGRREVARARSFYERYLYPKMGAHQRAIGVPGTFASDPAGCAAKNVSCPLAAQAAQVVAKLDGYFAWGTSDARLVGYNPWHWRNRSSSMDPGSAWDLALGAVAMPDVVARLRAMGEYIRRGGAAGLGS